MAAEVDLVHDARHLARELLRKDRPRRWLHTQGVGNKAAELTKLVPRADREALVAAAWVHDIGSSATIAETGFSPYDSAFYLLENGWAPRIAGLVAHQSGAALVARALGLGSAMAEFECEVSEVLDTLTYADQIIGRNGRPTKVSDRLAATASRLGPKSAYAKVRADVEREVLASVKRTEARLRALRKR